MAETTNTSGWDSAFHESLGGVFCSPNHTLLDSNWHKAVLDAVLCMSCSSTCEQLKVRSGLEKSLDCLSDFLLQLEVLISAQWHQSTWTLQVIVCCHSSQQLGSESLEGHHMPPYSVFKCLFSCWEPLTLCFMSLHEPNHTAVSTAPPHKWWKQA